MFLPVRTSPTGKQVETLQILGLQIMVCFVLFLNGHNCQLLSNFGIMFKNWTMEIHVQLNYNHEGLDPGSATHHLVISSLLTVLSSAKRPKTMSVAWGVLRIK